jgi:hypothetical protein
MEEVMEVRLLLVAVQEEVVEVEVITPLELTEQVLQGKDTMEAEDTI